MKKKILSILLVAIMVITVGCGKKDKNDGVSINEVPLEDVHSKVKEAYGENYIPSMPLDETMLKETYGIDPEWYEEMIAEGPMISAQIDTFIAVKAKDEKAADVQNALNAYHEVLKQDTFQYPSNLVKIQAAKVVAYGDYVFFLMLGMIPMEVEEQGEDAILKAYEAENQKAIDAIEAVLVAK